MINKNITNKEWKIIDRVIRSMFKNKPNWKPNPREIFILKNHKKQ
jgi:hypothetical protein